MTKVTDIKEAFRFQLENNTPITKDSPIITGNAKQYDDSDIIIGQKVIYALLKISDKDEEITYKLIVLTEDKIDNFILENESKGLIPHVVLK